MSSNFKKLLNNSLKICFFENTKYKKLDEENILINSFLFICGSFLHLSYALRTSNFKYSKIIKKYKIVRNGFTDFMIITADEKHYNVNNSLWYWKWNSIEDWHKMQEGDTIYFNYYGWRIDFLGIFPNIYYYRYTIS
jgi:hypothetical protein